MNKFGPMDERSLLTYSEVAERFGITRDAARMLAKRRGWKKKQPNNPGGQVRVEVPEAEHLPEQVFTQANGVNVHEQSHEHSPVGQADVHQHTEPMVPLSHMDRRLYEQQERHEAEMNNRLAERDRLYAAELARMSSLHLDLIGRIQAQASAERGLFLERVDAAELRAEAAEARAATVDQKLHQVLDRLLERPSSVVPTPEQASPWWSRWFGQTKRSDIGC